MPDVVIYKDETGKLAGLGDTNSRRWMKFRRAVDGLEVGETLRFHYSIPRSPKHHRFFFWRLGALFARQESFEDEDHLLVFLKVGAGYVDFMPGHDGQLVAVPKSIAWHSLDEQGFIEFGQRMNAFLWTPAAQLALWPHLDAQRRYDMVEQWHLEGDQR